MSCWWCGSALAAEDRFCRQCGESRRSDGPWEHGADPGLWPAEGENRVLTVVFPDLCGYMAASRQAPGDEAVALVNTVQGTYIAAVHEHGGFIARCQHDEVLALFGVPTARVDAPVQAIRAALAIRTAIRALGLDVKIGINTGLVYFGPVGSVLHSELAVVGPPADVAARLVGKGAQVALPGQILVGASTYQQAQHEFDFGEGRVLELKGIRYPVTSYEVLDRRAAPSVEPAEPNADARWSRIASGLDGLARSARQLLQVASVIGAPFEAALLGRVVPDRARLPEALEHLVAAGWLGREGERFRIGDAAVAEVLYQSLLPARRAELHAAIAAARGERGHDD